MGHLKTKSAARQLPVLKALAPRFMSAPWGNMAWLIDDAITPNAGMSLARMEVLPGHTSESHVHPNCSESIHLLSGEVTQTIGAQQLTLKAGDTVFIPAGATHCTANKTAEVAVMMVSYSSGTREYKTL